MIMKNKYIAPAIAELEIVAESIIASSTASSTTIKVGEDVETTTTDAGRAQREWGDLWK